RTPPPLPYTTLFRSPLRQHRPRPPQPAGNGPFGQSELPGRLLATVALQITKDKSDPVLVRQAAQLLVEERLQIMPVILVLRRRFRFGHVPHLPFPRPPPGRCRPRLACGLVRRANQKVARSL